MKVIMFELPVTNVKRASAFYQKAFGWQINPWNGSYGVITVPEDKNWVPKVKGAINGEMYRRGSKNEKPRGRRLRALGRPRPRRREAGGGKGILEKEDYGEWGWYARVQGHRGQRFRALGGDE